MRMQRKHKVEQFFSVPQTEEGITPVVQRILLSIDEWRKERPIGRILLYYNKPIGKASMKEVQETLFPLDLMAVSRKPKDWNSKSLPVVLMDRERVLSDLIQQIFFITLYRTFCFSLVTENASRLASMQSAEKNIQERLEELEFVYRRERQSQITEDISDIISGYKAIKKHKPVLE
jgi:F-type H+-transporting ATPase subunit gamma